MLAVMYGRLMLQALGPELWHPLVRRMRRLCVSRRSLRRHTRACCLRSRRVSQGTGIRVALIIALKRAICRRGCRSLPLGLLTV